MIILVNAEKNATKRKTNLLTGRKNRKKAQEERQRRDPSPRRDKHAIDVACTQQNNKITNNKLHWKNIGYKWYYMWSVWRTTEQADASPNELFIYNAVCWGNALIYLTQWCQLQNCFCLFSSVPLEFLISPVYVPPYFPGGLHKFILQSLSINPKMGFFKVAYIFFHAEVTFINKTPRNMRYIQQFFFLSV